ncbi:MAG: hypothetical protein KDE27_12250 [Planctomycetes bacterium]|nr:hypothetical protein [Planctomycetota bacterium]
MSPIGRVFIVLNLALAGGFVFFAGTHLQQQHNYKEQLQEANDKAAEKEKELTAQIDRLSSERTQLEVAKSQREAELTATQTTLKNTEAENTRLSGLLSEMNGNVSKLLEVADAGKTKSEAAFDRADKAYADARQAMETRDAALRERDATTAENKKLNDQIAALEATIEDKDGKLADMEKERSELTLLVNVAEQNGFVPGLAAPTLAGTVSHVANNRLCTIVISDNPGNVDIADQLSKRKFSFAVYDASGYKGEAVATEFYPAENAITCRLDLVKGSIKVGDKASTKTP